MALRKHGHSQVPIWIKLRHLPVELWTIDGLSTVASGIGCPLTCPTTKKPMKPPVSVFVPKPRVHKEDRGTAVNEEVAHEMDTYHPPPTEDNTMAKGKELMVYNPFDALELLDSDVINERGPNDCSPENDDWNWFTDHTESVTGFGWPGTHRKIDVNVLVVHQQCLHCRVLVKRTHVISLITMIYGSNDVIERRGLWEQVLLIMETVEDEPWLVLVDFNTVLDLSKLSFAAWVQLLRSVISSLNTYWAMAFVLPKGVIRDIEARMRKFLWHGNSSSGMAKNQNSVWVTWVLAYRLKTGSVSTVNTNTGSWSWRKIVRLRNQLLGHIKYTVGTGANTLLWHDLDMNWVFYFIDFREGLRCIPC
ncbi:UNVERIFIED_CONTAM: hypothetical protein Slati_0895200 [Sesamum latifolium]|uniref:DUF4283 domain-containing protein n=1 Tax=Sesamum latifolium TaxID=2727402 RepID=A0AAW2XND4_9LAMI